MTAPIKPPILGLFVAGLGLCLVAVTDRSALAAPTPDFVIPGGAAPATPPSNLVPVPPVTVGAPAAFGGIPSKPPQKSLGGIGDDIPLPDPSLASHTAQSSEDSSSGGDVLNVTGVFQKLPFKDWAFMHRIIDDRKRAIEDTLKKRIATLEGKHGLHLANDEKKPRKVVVVAPAPPPVKKGPADHGITVLGIHEDRVFIKYGTSSSWTVLGSMIGDKFRLVGVTSDNATFQTADGKKFTVKKAPKVIPRPEIVVTGVSGQTATIKYKGNAYTVTLNSPIGSDLTVTALNSTNFSVQDDHGRVFTYPVPQASVASVPGAPGMPGGYVPPPPSPYPGRYGAPGANTGGGAAEDNNY